MAGFSEQTMQRKLSELSNTLPSIQTVSLWLIHHRKHSKVIAEVWLKELRRERDPRKLLTLVYLANDVLQNSRKRWPMFRDHFQPSLIAGLSHVARYCDKNILPPVRRVLDVWRQRNVYEDEFLTRLTYAVTSNLSRDMLALFNQGSRTPPRPQDKKRKVEAGSGSSSKSPNGPPPTTFSKPKSYGFGSPLTPPLGGELPLNFLRTPEDEEDAERQLEEGKKETEQLESILSEESANELMNSLKELEQAASADVRTREQIAQFPPDVADLSKLKNMTTKEAVDRFATQVNQANAMLTEYNARLLEEMEKRKSTLTKLDRFVNAHKRRIEEETKELAGWRDKLAKLSTYRQELLTHVQSLPDLSKLPDPSQLPPLPSVGDLFTK